MIRAQTKRVVRAIFVRRCAYCGVTETQTGAELTYDHFQPQSHGGTDAVSNLVYACHACNEYKGDYWSPDAATRLLHPLNDDLTLHIEPNPDGTLQALTPPGKVYIARLQLNRVPLIAQRLERERLARIEEHIAELHTQVAAVLQKIARLEQ